MKGYYEPWEFTWERWGNDEIWITHALEDHTCEEEWNRRPLSYWVY